MFKVYLYTDRAPENLKIDEVKRYLFKKGFDVETRGDFFRHFTIKEGVAEDLARIRIKDITREGVLNPEPSIDDVKAELGILKTNEPLRLKRDLTNVYEGWEFVSLIRGFLKGDFHILFTSRMLATWSDRYHGRTIIIHPPLTVISTTGIVEAPIKPPEYYAKLMGHQRAVEMGFPVADLDEFERELKGQFGGRFIDYDDERLTEVTKGFTMQGLVYFLTTDAFCEDPDCRLLDAHTQEDLIRSQLSGDEFCKRHQRMVEDMRKDCVPWQNAVKREKR